MALPVLSQPLTDSEFRRLVLRLEWAVDLMPHYAWMLVVIKSQRRQGIHYEQAANFTQFLLGN